MMKKVSFVFIFVNFFLTHEPLRLILNVFTLVLQHVCRTNGHLGVVVLLLYDRYERRHLEAAEEKKCH